MAAALTMWLAMEPTRPITTASDRTLNQGYAIALTGVLFWSTTAIFISYLLENYSLGRMTLAFWRDLFTTMGLGIGLFVVRRNLLRIEVRHRRFLVGYGLSLALMNLLWTHSIGINGAAVSTVLVYSSPAFTAVAARILFGEALTRLRVAAILASLIGCVLVSGAYTAEAWAVNADGILIGVGSGVAFTLYSLAGKSSSRRGVNPWTATVSAFGVATVVFFLVVTAGPIFASRGEALLSLGSAADGWLILFVLAVVPTVAGFGLYTASLGYLPTSTVNLIATLEPALTAVWAFLLLGESFSVAQLAGSLLIFAGVVSLRSG